MLKVTTVSSAIPRRELSTTLPWSRRPKPLDVIAVWVTTPNQASDTSEHTRDSPDSRRQSCAEGLGERSSALTR
jgi:hypothetical protein